jgi:hypothetical protein
MASLQIATIYKDHATLRGYEICGLEATVTPVDYSEKISWSSLAEWRRVNSTKLSPELRFER